MPGEPTKVLIVDDDEDDFILTRDLFSQMPGSGYSVSWTATFQEGLSLLEQKQQDICLVDYRLGARNGIDFVREAIKQGCQIPLILLTGAGAHQIDVEAMEAGAEDYLVKGRFDAGALERTIRYALQRKQAAAEAARQQARLAAFGAEVGLALTQRDSLEKILQRCAQAVCRFLDVAACEIATYDNTENTFTSSAVALAAGAPFSASTDLPKPALDLGFLISGQKIIIPQLHEGLTQEQAAAFRGLGYAACPLRLEDKLVGLVSFIATNPSEKHLQEINSVANGIALCIDRKKSAEALDRSEHKYRAVVESIREVIFQLDRGGRWSLLNPAWKMVTGFSLEQTLGTSFLEYIFPEDRAHNEAMLSAVTRGGMQCSRYETRFLTTNGDVRWVEIFLYPKLDKGGMMGVAGTLADISDRKAAEMQVQKLAAFPQLNPNPVLEFSAAGVLTYANGAAFDLMKRLDQPDLVAILPPNAGGIARECLRTNVRNLGQKVEIKQRVISWSFFPITASDTVHCYGDDVTEMISLEEKFRHSQRLESVGRLAAGVAHDFNNLLTVIQGYAEFLLTVCADDPRKVKPLTMVSQAATRAASLTRQLLFFSRKQAMQSRVVDFNALIEELSKMLTRMLTEDIAFTTDLAPDLWNVVADPGMLEQIVMNLAVNARDAMPDGGRFHMATRNVSIDATHAKKNADAHPGQFVLLETTDTGCGMDTATMKRIFEPFFTTKPIGKGSGLGLATVYGIVKQHDGWIEVTSAVGAGSTFQVYLPATTSQKNDSELFHRSGGAPRGGDETILLVEDEHAVREFAREVLSSHNYRVLEAPSGPAALEVWEKSKMPIDLLLTDMVMPGGMSGRDLATQLRMTKPELKVLYSSGYDPDVVAKQLKPGEGLFLPKPYTAQQLAGMLRQALDGFIGRQSPQECVAG